MRNAEAYIMRNSECGSVFNAECGMRNSECGMRMAICFVVFRPFSKGRSSARSATTRREGFSAENFASHRSRWRAETKNPHSRLWRQSSPLSSLERFAFSERVSNRSALNRIYSERSDPQRQHRHQFTRRSGGSIHGDGSHQFTRRTPQFTRLWRNSRRNAEYHLPQCGKYHCTFGAISLAQANIVAPMAHRALYTKKGRIAASFFVCYLSLFSLAPLR